MAETVHVAHAHADGQALIVRAEHGMLRLPASFRSCISLIFKGASSFLRQCRAVRTSFASTASAYFCCSIRKCACAEKMQVQESAVTQGMRAQDRLLHCLSSTSNIV